MYPLSYMLGLVGFKDGAWFEPSDDKKVEVMLSLLDLKPGQKAVDLGSGDGKIVIEMARRGAFATGIERNKQLVELAQQNIAQADLTSHAAITQASFWDVSLKEYEKVCLFQFKTVMQRLEDKLLRELPSHSLVVSNYWQFPTWKPEKHIDDVYLYIKP